MTSNFSNDEDRKSYVKVGLIYNAIINNYEEIVVEKLLETEGDINYKISESPRKVSNLLYVAINKKLDYLDLLLEYGADFVYQNEKGKTALHTYIYDPPCMAKAANKSSNIDLILCAHVQLNNLTNPSDRNGMTHFHAACIRNHSLAIEFFLKNGVDVNLPIKADIPHDFTYTSCDIKDYFPRYLAYTPLHLAAKHSCQDATRILLKHGADIHLKNCSGLTPLHLMIKKTIEELDKDVKDKKYPNTYYTFEIFMTDDNFTSNINDVDEYGFSTFHAYCFFQDDCFVESIIKRVKNINQQVNFDSPICPGYTPLHFAAYSNVQMFELLLRNGADVEATNSKGQTPLDLCLQNYTAEEIHSILLAKPEWKNIVLSNNETTLVDVVAALKCPRDFYTFSYQIQSASNLIVPFDSPLWPGYTILHCAVMFSDNNPKCNYYQKEFEFIEECLHDGADMTMQDAKGATAIHLAFYMKKDNVVRFLLENYDESENLADKNNWSLLHIACLVNKESAVKYLLSCGANVNSQVNSTFEYNKSRGGKDKRAFICPGSTPLHINIAVGHKRITEILMRYGADVNIQDVYGFTALHRVLSNETDAYESLLSAKNLKNITTSHGLSHLHVVSILNNNAVTIKRLLKLGADINAPITYKADANWRKIQRNSSYDPYGDPQKPVAFLSQYAGYTPLHLASDLSYKYTPDTILCLSKKNANLLAECDEQTLPIVKSIKFMNNSSFVYVMIMKKSDIFQKFLEQEYRITMLHVAVWSGKLKLMKRLIMKGANVNAKVNSNSPIWNGYTPLHLVVKFVCKTRNPKIIMNLAEKIVRLLMEHGADVLSLNDNNDTPIHFIKYLKCRSIGSECKVTAVSFLFEILFENIESINSNPVNNQGLSIFHVACLTANIPMIEKFLKCDVDVNQAIGYYSNICPGSTPLHLIIMHYCDLYNQSSNNDLIDKTFLQVVDLLLKEGANVNATDASRSTPLHVAVQLRELRQIMLKKFIHNGADVLMTNVLGNTAFEDFLSKDDIIQEEIDLFLNAGASFHAHNKISETGYLAVFLNHHREILASSTLRENHLVLGILSNPNIAEIDDTGRTMIHNVVSIKWKKEFVRTCPIIRQLFDRPDIGIGWRHDFEAIDTIYPEIIEELLIQGCDIDYQDNDGKTALHLAVAFRNNKAIIPLLKNGADINLLDMNDNTAFSYGFKYINPYPYPRTRDEIDWDKIYANKCFAKLIYKLEYCNQPVHRQNKRFQEKFLEYIGTENVEKSNSLRFEMAESKSIKIGNTSLSLYEFVTNENISIVYANMTIDERRELDHFYNNIEKYKFRELDCIIKLIYRQTVGRTKLYDPAVNSLNFLITFQMPDIITRKILNLLTNEELKQLIDSAY